MKGLTKGVTVLAAAALASFVAVVAGPAGPASAASATYTNACRNSAVPTNWDEISVTMNGLSPASVAPGDPVTLTGLSLQMSIPGAIFVAGYNLGLLGPGVNNIPGDIHAVIDATNAVAPTSQSTNTVSAILSTTISDPDGTPGSGDETATDASATVSFNDMTFTAGASGQMKFAEHNDAAITGVAGGGIVAIAHLAGGLLNVQFHCTSGTVANGGQPAPPAVVTFIPAPPFTFTDIVAPNLAPIANAGPDQAVNSAALVTLDGSASSDPNPGDTLSYAWTQTLGPPVSLTGANSVNPTFIAPTGPADLTFSLVVTDNGSPPLSSAPDTVNVHVNAPADATATSLAVTQTGFVNTPITFDSDVTDVPTPASIPQGTVSWYDNGSAVAAASAHTDASGHATATLPSGFGASGSHSVVAKFVPDNPALFEMSQSQPVVFDLAPTAGCSLPGSICTDQQAFQVTVPAGSLVISTPWTPANPFDLGTMALDPTGTYLHTSAAFGTPSLPGDGVTITDTRAGDLAWTASVTSSDFANGSNLINACNLGFTGVTPVQIGANALGTPAKPVLTTDVPNGGSGGIAAPGGVCSTGLAAGPHAFATAAHGAGSVNIVGAMDLYAPTSTPAGTYMATVTFTIA
jgi:hypothetical protein